MSFSSWRLVQAPLSHTLTGKPCTSPSVKPSQTLSFSLSPPPSLSLQNRAQGSFTRVQGSNT